MSAPAAVTVRKSIYDQAKASVLAARKAQSRAARAENPQHKVSKTQSGRPAREHGQHIYVYQHLQKNHIVYSLTREMKNNAALRQLPYNGKKTVPAALRKDLWSPFATIKFPSGYGSIGLGAFQKLREYRKRHELEWGDEIRFKEPTAQDFLDMEAGKRRKQEDLDDPRTRGRKIADQLANSVADMAVVLGRLGEEAKDLEEKTPIGLKVPEIEGEAKPVDITVLWRDVHDAEFAPTWSSNVEHGELNPLPEESFEETAQSHAVATEKMSWWKEKKALKREIYEEAVRLQIQHDQGQGQSASTAEAETESNTKPVWKLFS